MTSYEMQIDGGDGGEETVQAGQELDGIYCVNDAFDPNGDTPYDSLEDFDAMCEECHGVTVDLMKDYTPEGLAIWGIEDQHGNWELVLEQRRAGA